MGRARDAGKSFGTKGGYKTRKRAKGISRAGLPKIYPPGSDGGVARMNTKVK